MNIINIELIIAILELIGYIGLWILWLHCRKLLDEVRKHTEFWYANKSYRIDEPESLDSITITTDIPK